ncbi:hypothetical protein ACFQXA_26815 [Nocardiopsis composta]
MGGEERVDGFVPGPEPGGPPVLRFGGTGDAGGTVLDDGGEVLWEGGDREVYLSGLVVRRPEGWTPDDPYGGFEVEAPDGGRLWEFDFAEPDGPAGPRRTGRTARRRATATPTRCRRASPTRSATGCRSARPAARSCSTTAPGCSRPAPPGRTRRRGRRRPRTRRPAVELRRGRPRAARRGHAAPPPPADPRGVPDPRRGGRGGRLPAEGAEDAGDGGDAAPERDAVLVRWSLPEEPSLLAMHDARTGEIAWTLPEPGANPAPGDFAPLPAAGGRFDSATGTLLLPQASGDVPLIAVDVADGEELWEFREDEAALSPAFAAGGYVYGDARGADDADSSQVVLEAATMDVAADGLDSYVEAVTDDGYAIVVHQRQRFVFAPAPDDEAAR